jgi:Xaa-Pro aminopeptidase
MKENLEKLSEAVLAALEQSQAGETEDIVHKRILATIRQDGIASVWGRLASGERVSLPNALAGKRVLGHGDLVRMDYSCTFRTYPARVCRMGVVGGPSEAQSATYERYLQAMQSAVARIGPDQSGGEIFSSARAALKEMGFQPVGSSVGYALGIAFEERPRLQAQEDFRTRAGMILCVEPQTAEGHRISQEVEITEDGSAILPSLFPLERLWILGN